MAKVCDLQIVNNKCYYRLIECSNEEFVKIVDYKSWLYKSWKYGIERKYFVWVYKNSDGEKIVWSYVGFAPILVRYLDYLGYIINGRELFRSKEILIGNMYYTLWDFQNEAVNVWVNSGCYGVIKAPTGSGKTIIASNVIKSLGLRTIICVHTSDLLINVWYNMLIEQFSEAIKNKMGIIGGGLSVKDRKEMRITADTGYEENIGKDIVIATSQSLLGKLDRICEERFGLVIADEIHRYPAEQFRKVLSSIRAPYRLGLSATLVRPDGMSPMIWGLVGNVVYRVGIKELVDKGILVEPVFKSVVVNDEEAQSKITTCGLSQLELSKYIKKVSAGSVVKKDYIIDLIKSLYLNGKKFLLYTDFITEIDDVFTRDYYVRELGKIGINVVGVSSEMSSEERENIFRMLKIGRLDGIVFGLLGSEGINIPIVDSVVMCNATKSTIRFPQRTGRAMRITGDNKKNAFIYEILINTPKELEWSIVNFYEYRSEGYDKERVFIERKEKL